MTSIAIVQVFISILILYAVTDIYLEYLNNRHAKKNASRIPSFMKDVLTEPEFKDSISYTVTKGRMKMAGTVFEVLLLTLIIFSGFLGNWNRIIISLLGSGIAGKIGYVLTIGFLFYLLHVPLQLYGQFIVEKRFGFSTITPKVWLLDQVKAVLLSGTISGLLLLGIFWYMNTAGTLWWLYAYLTFVVIQLFLTLIYPVAIAPLFNKFVPMEDGPLKIRLLNLTERLDFPVKGLFVMDGSKRSRHSNAYFTGIGSSKRIVLFDTLIEQMSIDEMESILAHEIGHFKMKHIIKSMVLSFFIILAGFLLIHALRDHQPLFSAFGVQRTGDHILIVLLIYFTAPFLFFLTPVFSFFSRKHEYEADRYAAGAVATGKHLIHGLKKLAAKNLSNLMPHKAYSTFHYSHPALNERIEKLSEEEAV